MNIDLQSLTERELVILLDKVQAQLLTVRFAKQLRRCENCGYDCLIAGPIHAHKNNQGHYTCKSSF